MIDRRTLLAAAGMALVPMPSAKAAARQAVALQMAPAEVVLAPGQPSIAAWRFVPADALRFVQGDEVDITITNRLPVGVLIDWRGLDGAAALEPMLARGPIPPGGSATFPLSLTHAGTLLCDARLGGDASAPTLPVLPLVVSERQPVEVDHDIALLVEGWRAGSETALTLNGRTDFALQIRPHDRLRLRFINGTQGSVLAMQLSGAEVRVIAIDGQPSELFPTRDGRLLLAPGTRIDAVVDAGQNGSHVLTVSDGMRTTKMGEMTVAGAVERAQPLPPASRLPSNGLPDKMPLEQALRINISLDAAAGWVEASKVRTAAPPAFKVKRDRTVVLALTNPSEMTMVFHLHGHHMRLLDRLDDGWKPFWLDTVAVPQKQTVRLAFAATSTGAFLMEAMSTGAQPARRFQIYRVEG